MESCLQRGAEGLICRTLHRTRGTDSYVCNEAEMIVVF
jgi:hypothetical protein